MKLLKWLQHKLRTWVGYYDLRLEFEASRTVVAELYQQSQVNHKLLRNALEVLAEHFDLSTQATRVSHEALEKLMLGLLTPPAPISPAVPFAKSHPYYKAARAAVAQVGLDKPTTKDDPTYKVGAALDHMNRNVGSDLRAWQMVYLVEEATKEARGVQ
jgi:hypothetical protein